MYVLCKIVSLLFYVTLVSGGETYNSSQLCCDGKLHNYSDSDTLVSQCCGKELLEYDLFDEIIPLCCDDVLNKKPESTGFECCGTTTYNTKTSICFDDNEIIPIPPGNIDNDEIKVCGADKSHLKYYNSEKHICCSNVLYPFEENIYCCGNITYDSSTSLCSDSNEVMNVGNSTNKASCGDKYYDINEALCCYDYLQLDNDMYKTVAVVTPLNDKSRASNLCCGLSIYNYKKEVCCSDGPITKPDPTLNYNCCGTKFLYDYDTQLCVDEKIINKTCPEEYLCGSEIYNYNEYFCYNNTLIKHAIDEEYCFETQTLYNKSTQVCTKNSVINLTDHDIDNLKIYYCED